MLPFFVRSKVSSDAIQVVFKNRQCCYSTTFPQLLRDHKDSFSDMLWKKGTELSHRAVEKSSLVAQSVAKEASKKASDSWLVKRKSLDQTLQKAQEAAKENVSKLTKATQQVTSQAVQQNIQRPIQDTSKRIGETLTSHKIVENMTSGGTKLIKWMAMWSLAAVFVYGVATATPMAILKFATRERDPEQQQQ
jgi:hypothetical protein